MFVAWASHKVDRRAPFIVGSVVIGVVGMCPSCPCLCGAQIANTRLDVVFRLHPPHFITAQLRSILLRDLPDNVRHLPDLRRNPIMAVRKRLLTDETGRRSGHADITGRHGSFDGYPDLQTRVEFERL